MARNMTLAEQASIPDGKGLRFQISTGGSKYICTLEERSHYERRKAARTDSFDSISSKASSSSSVSRSS